MTQPIVIVSGLARCGSTVCMCVLEAGGFPVVGRPPRMELPAVDELPANPEWVHKIGGMALKVLDPHDNQLPPGPRYRVIWLDRNLKQQAKSQIKAQRHWWGMEHTRRDVPAMKRLLRSLRTKSLNALAELGAEFHFSSYESIVNLPRKTAVEFAEFIGEPLDIAAMVDVVWRRRAECAAVMLEDQIAEASL